MSERGELLPDRGDDPDRNAIRTRERGEEETYRALVIRAEAAESRALEAEADRDEWTRTCQSWVGNCLAAEASRDEALKSVENFRALYVKHGRRADAAEKRAEALAEALELIANGYTGTIERRDENDPVCRVAHAALTHYKEQGWQGAPNVPEGWEPPEGCTCSWFNDMGTHEPVRKLGDPACPVHPGGEGAHYTKERG